MILNEPKAFVIDTKGSITGQIFQGTFKIRPLLSHRDKLRQDEFKRQILGNKPESATPSSDNVASVFSKIWVHLADAPAWWKEAGNGFDLLDEEPVMLVLEKILEIESEIAKEIGRQGEAAKQALAEQKKE